MFELGTLEDFQKECNAIGKVSGPVDFLGGIAVESAKNSCSKAMYQTIKYIEIMEKFESNSKKTSSKPK